MSTPPKTAADLKGKSGLTRLINATRYSKDGFAAAFKSEEAFRQESILALVLVVVLPFIPADLSLKLLAFMSLVFVLVTELLNSGIEAAIDRIGPEIHPMSKFAKDVGSCAVLFSLICAAVVWITLLWSAFV
ncbi:MAG: diacylglycerol kinase [Sutterellaceae bacterium]|nr:diacylglycerol kinase [Sutterellaceae bacterium]